MTDEELIARLRERAAEERDVQRNNEAVAAALMGQRLLFDQGIRSKANSFAVRLGLEHDSCAKNDAKLARDWDAAADRIEALVKEMASGSFYKESDIDALMKERDDFKRRCTNAEAAILPLCDERDAAEARAERMEAALRKIAEGNFIGRAEGYAFAALKGSDHAST